MKKTTILYIDDDTNLYPICGKPLQDAGYTVDFAKDGVEGFQKIKEFKYDIILLDIMMPRMDGIEVLKQIKTNNIQHGKIIMFTNLDSLEIKQKAFELGAANYWVKSQMTPEEFVQKVNLIPV